MREKVFDIVKTALDDLNQELGYEEFNDASEETGLHGGDAILDSLSLVSLIVDICPSVSRYSGMRSAMLPSCIQRA